MKIISASRRGDMPAFHMATIVKKFNDSPDAFFVLWTKDPRNIVKAGLDPKRVALQLTVTGLGSTRYEPGVPQPDIVWDSVGELLAQGYNKNLIWWRLDPVIPGVTTPKMVTQLADRAQGLGLTRCIISFITFYDAVKACWPDWQQHEADKTRQVQIVQTLHGIMKPRGITLFGCAQPHLSTWLLPSCCIDGPYYASVLGYDFSSDKDAFQRKACGCTESVDIGQYGVCPHECVYCYACPKEKPAATDDQLRLF